MLWVQEIPALEPMELPWGPLISPSCCSRSSWRLWNQAGTGKRIESLTLNFLFLLPHGPMLNFHSNSLPQLGQARVKLRSKQKSGRTFRVKKVWGRSWTPSDGETSFHFGLGRGLPPQACGMNHNCAAAGGSLPPTTRASGKQAEGNRWALRPAVADSAPTPPRA